MVEIALFDTDPAEQYQLDDMLTAVMFTRDDFHITFYTSYTLFACDISQQRKRFDLLFVNISTPDNAGLMAAEYARRMSDSIEIVMTDVDYSHLMLGYRVKALNYILKPYDKAQVAETIDRFYEFFEKTECFFYKNGYTVEKVRLDSILYFFSSGRKVIIELTGDEEKEFYGKLDDVAATLEGKNFVRSHKSYLVNKRAVVSITKDKLVMENDVEIPISRNRIGDVRIEFNDNITADLVG